MENYKSKKDIETDELVDILIELPVNNLEKKISELESEIDMRKIMFDAALLSMDNHQLGLHEDIQRMIYFPDLEFASNKKIVLKKEIIRTDIRKIDEWVSYFRDMSKLKDKLRTANEELAQEKLKRKLIKT